MPTRPAADAFLESVVQAPVGQLHDDDQFAVDDLDAVHRQDERMADLLDALEGLQFLLGAGAVHVEGIEVAVDELDGLEQAARGLALPDFAEAAAAQRLDQAVAGNRLRIGFPQKTHGSIPLPVAANRARARQCELRRNGTILEMHGEDE